MAQEKRHIFICIDWFEPGYKAGGPIRSVAHIIEALHPYYRFSIFTTDRDLGDKEGYPDISVNEWIERDHYRIWYASPDRRSYRNIRGVLNEGSYDVLYLQSMFSYRFTFLPIWAHRAIWPETPIVLAPRGMLHQGALSMKSRKKTWFLKLWKWLQLPKDIVFQATDAQEIKDIQSVFGEVEIEEVANLPRMELPERARIEKEKGELKLVFFSRLTEKKGLHIALEALRGQDAAIQLDLYGVQDEPAYWKRCQQIISELPPQVTVAYKGTVPPPEAAATLQQYHGFIMPTRGENFGHAIFEALAAGIPVLITDQSPWQDLNAQFAGATLPVDAVDAFAEKIRQWADWDQATFDKWSAGARSVAQNSIDQLTPLPSYQRLFDLPKKS